VRPSPTPTTARDDQASRDIPLWMLYPLFFVVVYLSHFTLLRLPYFWDEAGYYIPAAWDFFRTGSLIPQTTLTNGHPPLPSILLAGWWHISGYVVSGTRTFICMVSAAALLGVYRLARKLTSPAVAAVTVLLTATYSIWFAQSTLAHADIFAAAFTLWGLSFYFERSDAISTEARPTQTAQPELWAAIMFSLSALSKETAIVTPLALALWEAILLLQDRRQPAQPSSHLHWLTALVAPVAPLTAWYAYHKHRTGFIFGNPEFLRYNATANLNAYRIALCLWHRLLHLTTHMNMFVPVVCAIAAVLIPVAATNTRKPIARPALKAIGVILLANWIAFSVLGGALLTRYLLPMYPLILLVCVDTWRQRIPQRWLFIAALSTAGFLSAIWINPPYAFAPEDNLTYRDMIVLHQQAVRFIDLKYPGATVLTAWPATAELSRPELGYTNHPVKTSPLQNFSMDEVEKAAADPGNYDTALIFSTKWAPPANGVNLGHRNESSDTKYFDFHRDLSPAEVATLLHGEIVWQRQRKGEWAAVLHFPRIVEATLTQPDKPTHAPQAH
jgi:4-amino-4-deoxy-L-arabinose transferase-like glycosyltransferase